MHPKKCDVITYLFLTAIDREWINKYVGFLRDFNYLSTHALVFV